MKTWILNALLSIVAMMTALEATSQSYKDNEWFKDFLQSYQNLSLEDKLLLYPEYINPDGSHRIYVVDTLNADCVEVILEDIETNRYAVVDTTSLISSKFDDLVDSNSAYLLILLDDVLVHIPLAGKFNAFCDCYLWEFMYFDADPELNLIQPFSKRPDYVRGEGYCNYFKKHSRKYGKKRYLEYPIKNKPLYYMVLLMEGKVYNELMSTFYSSTDFNYKPIKFRDPSAYYRVLFPVFQEID